MAIPGLPDDVYNTYRQYKQSCHVIHRWVHATVSRIRAEEVSPNLQPTAASKNKKGKSKMQSRNSRSNQGKSTSESSLPGPPWTFSTFLSLLREIASSKVARIPTFQLTLLNMIIRQRKATAAFYSPDADAWRRNETHRKAIELYQEALEILETAYRERGGAEDNTAVGIADDNIFGLTAAMRKLVVAVEEEAASQTQGEAGENEWIRDNPLLRPSGSKDKQKAKVYPLEAYEVYPDDERPPQSGKSNDGDEAWLGLQCFILDIDRIRKYVASIWKTVSPLGNTSRFTASFITNHAVHMVKRLEYDFLVDFPQFKDIQTTQLMLIVRFTELLFGAPEETIYSMREQLMANTWLTLNAFAEVLDEPGSSYPVMRDGHFGYFKPKASRESMTPTQRTREDKCIICNWWPDLVIMYKHDKTVSKSGKFLGDFGLPREFRPFLLEDSHPKSWTLLFSCQIMLDIVHIRRRVLQVDVDSMRALGRRLYQEIDTFLGNGVTYDTNMSEAQNIARVVNFGIEKGLLTDFLTLVKVKNGWDKLSMQACQPDSFWLHNPWLTANSMTDALMDAFMLSTGVMGAGGFVQSAIHLWNMLKQTGHLPVASEANEDTAVIDPANPPRSATQARDLLLDHLVDVFGDKVFSGPPPAKRFLTRFELMLGVRAEEFAVEKRGRKKIAQTSYRNHAYNQSGRGVTALDSDAWRLHNKGFVLEKLWASQGRKKPASSDQHPLAYVQALAEAELVLGGSEASDAKGPLVSLDILKIHQLCIRLFGQLHEALQGDFTRVFGLSRDELIPTQIQWPMITGWIMRSGELSGGGLDQGMLAKAGEVVQKIVGTKELAFYVITDVDVMGAELEYY
ncbi:hypothetical protein D9615_005911 [Tricholomella constricta]|uniref:DUF6604 domain-containing protein n=1 Tax=Tricholomella constricta TaxID=117010 RepID=A0A8H5H9D7_9AGAR|nr:hypothetical protein D9615_005911 [Tricholomella constricta]